jgi:hypothetical protein
VSNAAQEGPSEDELVAFATRLLSSLGTSSLTDAELVRETVREARELWVKLYEVEAADGRVARYD